MSNNIVQKTSENSENLTREEAQDLREEVRNTAEFYTNRLVEFIRDNTGSLPEYSTNTGSDVSPDKSPFYSGINLDRVRPKQSGITLDDFLTSDLNPY